MVAHRLSGEEEDGVYAGALHCDLPPALVTLGSRKVLSLIGRCITHTKEDRKMKRMRTLLRTFGVMIFLGLASLALPLPAHARVQVSVGLGLPLPVFVAPA